MKLPFVKLADVLNAVREFQLPLTFVPQQRDPAEPQAARPEQWRVAQSTMKSVRVR